MENSTTIFDVIIIGAGVMGSSAAYQATKRGKKTLLLEQFDLLHYRGSSHGESRTIRATYPEDYYSSMVLESSRAWEEAESEIGYKVYFKTSQFDMGPKNDSSLQAVISSCQKNSIPHKIVDHLQVEKEYSGKFHLPENWVGVVTENGGVLKPTKAVSMFQTLALKNGAVVKDNTEVVDIVKDNEKGGVCVWTKCNDQKFWGKKCIITAGPWMKKLIKKVSNLDLPIQPLETTVYYWRIKNGKEREFTIENGFPTFASYGAPYIYGTPSLEFPGLIKIPVHGGRLCDPDQRTWEKSQVAVESLKEWIKGRFGEEVVEVKEPVMTQSCMYSMTPDEDFVIDYLGGEFREDVVVGGGFSGHGFKMAPVVGRILVDLVSDGGIGNIEEIKHFKLARFKENGKGNVKVFADQVNLDNLSI